MQSCGFCYFTFVVLHLHTACPSSLQELEQRPLSIHHLLDMAYIQRTGGGVLALALLHPHFTSPNAAGKIIANYF